MSSQKYADALRMRDTAKTADQWREEADEWSKRAQESWDRSDTDGALSQWASDTTAREYRAWAALAENNYRAEFPALFTADGELVPDAKYVKTLYGWAWVCAAGWFNPSEHSDPERRLVADRRKGYTVGTVRRDAFVVLEGETYTNVAPRLVAIRDSAMEVVETVSEAHYSAW